MQQTNTRLNAQHELRPLPFRTGALAPHISKETLEHHYGKHHRGYVNKLNQLVADSEFEGMALADVVRHSQGALFNNAAQVWNHNFYWNCLTPKTSGRAAGALARAIDSCFGPFDAFAVQFKSSAAATFGAGWTWLVKLGDGSVAIRNADDADNPLRWNQTPLLTCDVWEHAYYIDYRNERGRHIEAYWQLVNWDFAERNFAEG